MSTLLLFLLIALLAGLSFVLFKEVKRISHVTAGHGIPDTSRTSTKDKQKVTHDTGTSPQKKKDVGNRLFSITYDDLNIKRSLDNFFGAYNTLIANCETQLLVHDYIDHGRVMEFADQTLLSDAKLETYYENYFAIIEAKAKEKNERRQNFEYIRILSLPPHQRYSKMDHDELLQHAIKLLFKPTQKHLYRMLDAGTMNLYLLPATHRAVSQVIVDKQYLVNEIDVYDRDLNCKPDIITINDLSMDEWDEMFINNQVNNLKSLMSKEFEVTFSAFQNAVKEIMFEREQQVKDLAEVLEG